jgi:hypothetical protein
MSSLCVALATSVCGRQINGDNARSEVAETGNQTFGNLKLQSRRIRRQDI